MEISPILLYDAYIGILELWYHLSAFILVISVIVFIHEGGHYLVAKACGVKIEEFAIGFGKEIIGFNDPSGTRWKLCLVPMGGYVKMFGDINPASAPDNEQLKKLTAAEEKVTFHGKKLWQKSAIVAAGPAANFLLAIIILSGFILTYGQAQTLPIVGDVLKESAAEQAGLEKGDHILYIDGTTIEDFSDIQTAISINTGTSINLTILRNNIELTKKLTPRIVESKDLFGNSIRRAQIGITSNGQVFHKTDIGIFKAIGLATVQTYDIAASNLKAIGQIVTGSRSVEDLGGPVKIAKYSGQATQMGIQTVLWFMVVVSIGLGLINLFPIPVLDGGHLMYYMIEALQGKPLAQKYQDYGLKAGMAFIILLAVVVTFNDIRQLVTS